MSSRVGGGAGARCSPPGSRSRPSWPGARSASPLPLPALLFAASNAVAEELAYRGALMRWLAPSLGIVGANLVQAIVFGLAHTGAAFVGPVLPTASAMVLAGFIAGVVVRRTGSLTL